MADNGKTYNKISARVRLSHLAVLLLSLVLFGCGTSRKTSRNVMIGDLSGTEYMEQVIAWSPSRTNLTAKSALTLNTGSGSPLKVTANLRIRRNEVIRLTVAPLLGIEVARIDITPDNVLIIDRMNKRYVRASFSDISSLFNTQVDFNVLQSLFLNEIFLPGKNSLTVTDASGFEISSLGSRAQLTAITSPRTFAGKLIYTFLTSATDGRLEETSISVKNSPYALRCTYTDFSALKSTHGSDIFPQRIKLSVIGADKPYSLQLDLSRLGTDSDWESTTQLSSKYKEITLLEALKMLATDNDKRK